MSHLQAAAPAQKEGDRGRVQLAKVARYWAGKRVGDVSTEDAEPGPSGNDLFASRQEDPNTKRTPIEAAVIVKKADPRLARLAKTSVEEARGEGRQRHACALHFRTHIIPAQHMSDSRRPAFAWRTRSSLMRWTQSPRSAGFIAFHPLSSMRLGCNAGGHSRKLQSYGAIAIEANLVPKQQQRQPHVTQTGAQQRSTATREAGEGTPKVGLQMRRPWPRRGERGGSAPCRSRRS